MLTTGREKKDLRLIGWFANLWLDAPASPSIDIAVLVVIASSLFSLPVIDQLSPTPSAVMARLDPVAPSLP